MYLAGPSVALEWSQSRQHRQIGQKSCLAVITKLNQNDLLRQLEEAQAKTIKAEYR